mmetsp:Transcript_59616/g.71633  ORF Transcript_59616/g.71633 Transcript_59616/m.71633 type:complete len:242 (-) Transcript_59616:829-1554(-)
MNSFSVIRPFPLLSMCRKVAEASSELLKGNPRASAICTNSLISMVPLPSMSNLAKRERRSVTVVAENSDPIFTGIGPPNTARPSRADASWRFFSLRDQPSASAMRSATLGATANAASLLTKARRMRVVSMSYTVVAISFLHWYSISHSRWGYPSTSTAPNLGHALPEGLAILHTSKAFIPYALARCLAVSSETPNSCTSWMGTFLWYPTPPLRGRLSVRHGPALRPLRAITLFRTSSAISR